MESAHAANPKNRGRSEGRWRRKPRPETRGHIFRGAIGSGYVDNVRGRELGPYGTLRDGVSPSATRVKNCQGGIPPGGAHQPTTIAWVRSRALELRDAARRSGCRESLARPTKNLAVTGRAARSLVESPRAALRLGVDRSREHRYRGLLPHQAACGTARRSGRQVLNSNVVTYGERSTTGNRKRA